MALKKAIELKNGIILNYHRIVNFSKITNISNMIEVASYTNKEQRTKEEEYQKIQQKNIQNSMLLTEEERNLLENGINVYIDTNILNTPYNENMTIKEAYSYLKTTEKFKDAEDI